MAKSIDEMYNELENNNNNFAEAGFESAMDKTASDENELVDALRAEGYSDDDIMGMMDEDDDDFEQEKIAMYEKGLMDELEKVADVIDPNDVIDYMRGEELGEIYSSARSSVQDAVEKIASKQGFFSRAGELLAGGKRVTRKGSRAGNIARMSRYGRSTKNVAGFGKKRMSQAKLERLKATAARLGLAGAVGGAGTGAYLATRNK